MNAEIEQAARADANHVVRFYDSEEFLVAELADYAADALRAGDAFVTIATPAHFEALCARLYERGFDADALIAEGRWVRMDCADTLHALLRDGGPDAAAFAEAVEVPIARLCASHRCVRAFGEMVAMQCRAGNYTGAIELETLWNGLLERLSIKLLCAYPMSSFDGIRGREAFARICAAHDEALPPERQAHVEAAPDEPLRAPRMIQPQHIARFYDDDASLLAELTEFALPALESDGAFVSIASPARQHALRAALWARGIDLDAAATGGRWVQLDGAHTLAALSRDGMPDRAAFVAAVEKPLAQLCKHHPDVRVFGEMVAMQCAAGDYAGAVKLEAFGNELVEKLPITVFCAYPMASFADPHTHADFTRICAAHDRVLSPAQALHPAQPGHAGLVTMLRQHATALEEEIRRRVKLEKRVKQRERELREKVDVLETLARVGKSLIGERDPDTLIHTIVDNALRFTAARCGGFAQKNGMRDGVVLTNRAGAHFGGMSTDAVARLFQPIFEGERIVHRGDLWQDSEHAGKPPLMRSFLAVPVPSHTGAVLGALFLGYPEPGALDTRDELILAGIATQATFAIETARLLEASRQWRRDLQRAVAQRTEELRRSELHLETLLAGITDYAIMLLDAEGRILTWNTGGERIFGYDEHEILGSHFSRFYTRAEHDDNAPQLALRVAHEKGNHEIEAWRTRKDGTRFWASAMLMSIRDDDGHVTGYAKVIRDLTEARVAEERLQQAQRMEVVGQLTGGIAHDFNNLLTIILGNIDEVLRLHPDDNAVRKAAERVSGAAERAATLTRQLLAFSRRQALKPVPVNATMLLAGMSDMLQRTLGENVRVRTTFSGNWACEVDAHQLESAILNLAINARDAMSEGGYLSLDVSNVHLDEELIGDDRVSGEFVVITVADTGTGMPAEILERACEPFFTTKPLGRGTGLGLSQVYGFVRQSGGHFAITSESGVGTTIRIFLPRSREERIPHTHGALPASMPHGHETVLLVEDEAGVRRYCAEQLRELGYTVLEAGDALSALRVLDEHPGIDLLLTDVGLPVMNGGELAKRAQAKRPDLAVLFASGYPRGIVQQRGQLPSDVELLPKPYTRMQLALRVRARLDAKPPRDDGASVRTLLLEDDASLRQTVAQLLLHIGVSVVEAGNLAETRAVIASGPTLDLAIVDMNLGGENGMDAIRDLRAKNPTLPVIIASGYGDAVQRNAGEADDGCTVILPKPYSLSVLRRTIVSLGFALRAQDAPPRI
ncbi:MAG TPA: MEDS domain-containing protein [Rhodanobacteraceae bacterium]|nr:MEDS domain-containing protein [Rhodanobacteraceae bacterium]